MIQSRFMNNIFQKYLDYKLKDIKWGEIEVNFKNNYKKTFKANVGTLRADIDIKSSKFFKDIFLGGELGFAESYINNTWETKNLSNLLKFLLNNQKSKNKNWINNSLFNFLEKIFFKLKSNSIKQSVKNIHYHYDLGNNFYKLWLDETMTYSSAMFKNDNDNLFDAQNNKYESIIENLNILKNDKILEIGSGWGGFLKKIFQKVGCKAEGLTISLEQEKYSKKISDNNFNILLKDYRNLTEFNRYDKIISIEMFEAVGKEYWDLYFKKINESLINNGKACFQIITINDNDYQNYINQVDFIQKYIFPGGILPSRNILLELFKKNNLELYKTISFGNDYAKTLRIWKENFNKNWEEISKLGFDNKFKNLWNYYLSYCETGFETNHTDVSQFYVRKIY